MVAITGVEPVRQSALGLESSVSTSSTISPYLVALEGLEPTRPIGQQILNLSRLPASPQGLNLLLFY